MIRRDARSFEQFYYRNLYHVHNSLARFGVPRRDIEDLGHEVFLIALRKLPQLELELAAERLWLGRIAYYLALAERRRAYRRLEVFATGTDVEVLCSTDGAPAAESTDLASLALSRLGAREIDMVYLHLVGELSFKQLGRICECDPKTARKRVLAALRRARAALDQRPSP